jgi:transcriptional regulator with XRE-family HTH domain
MSIGEIIQKLRKEKGLTQEQLAKEVGLSKSAIIKYENNVREPNFEAITKLENYFKVSVNYLMGKSKFKRISDELFYNKTLMIDERLKDKPHEIQEMVISLLNSFNDLIDKIIERDGGIKVESGNTEVGQKRLTILRSLVEELDHIYFSNYLPAKDLWENGHLSELEFYQKKETILKKHLDAMEHYLKEAFTLRCGELYQEYILKLP